MRWSASVGSSSSTYRFWIAGPQDHLAADADGRGLGPGGQRGYVDREVAGRVGPGRPAASRRRAARGVNVLTSCRVTGVAAVDPDLALVAGAVAAAGGVDRDAVPGRGVEDGDARRHPDPRSVAGPRGARP